MLGYLQHKTPGLKLTRPAMSFVRRRHNEKLFRVPSRDGVVRLRQRGVSALSAELRGVAGQRPVPVLVRTKPAPTLQIYAGAGVIDHVGLKRTSLPRGLSLQAWLLWDFHKRQRRLL